MTTELAQEQIKPFVLAAHGDFTAVKEMLAAEPALLNHGAEVNTLNRQKRTPLDGALTRGHEEIADLLRQFGSQETVVSP